MDASYLTATAEQAAQRYSLCLGAFQAIRQNLSGARSPASQATRDKALRQGYEAAQVYLTDEVTNLQREMEGQALVAATLTQERVGATSEIPWDDVRVHVGGLSSELERDIRTQLERDVATIGISLREIGLRAKLVTGATAHETTENQALLKIRAGQKDAPFVFRDRAGRQWASSKYIRTVWRKALVLAWNETALLTMAANGVERATIHHTDANYAAYGMKITLSEDDTLPSWEDVRDDIFHPNTHAWLEPDFDVV